MSVDILVPPLSQTMDSLMLVAWLKKTGETVTKGEPLFTVETDKATLDVEAPASGLLLEVTARAGEEVKVRSSIGKIGQAEEALSANPVEATVAVPVGETTIPQQGMPGNQPITDEKTGRIFITPRARGTARRAGVRVEELPGKGTGPGAMIVERDVLAYLNETESSRKATPVAKRMAQAHGMDVHQITPAAGDTIHKADVEAALSTAGMTTTADQPAADVPGLISLTATRRTIARRMSESHATIPPVTYMRDADATSLLELRQRLLGNLAGDSIRPTITDILVRILCRVLVDHPSLNATFNGEYIVPSSHVHMALAIETERGLVAPVIRNAEMMGVMDLAASRTDLAQRAQSGNLKPEELTGGSFTLTNLGASGVDFFTPIINPPQVAILGVGRIRQAAAVHQGQVCVRSVLGLALTCDHRVIDGAPAARFLKDVCDFIETPELFWL